MANVLWLVIKFLTHVNPLLQKKGRRADPMDMRRWFYLYDFVSISSLLVSLAWTRASMLQRGVSDYTIATTRLRKRDFNSSSRHLKSSRVESSALTSGLLGCAPESTSKVGLESVLASHQNKTITHFTTHTNLCLIKALSTQTSR